MKKNVFLFLGLLVSVATFAQEITPKQVIENYITAIGGKERIAEIKDITSSMSSEVQGQTMQMFIQKKSPDKLFNTVTLDGMGEVNKTVCDGKRAVSSSMGNTQELDSTALESAKKQASIVPELLYLEGDNEKMLAFAGKEDINGKSCYKLTITVNGKSINEFYSTETGLKVRTLAVAETPMGETTVIVDYDDYREVAGVKFPYVMKQDLGMISFDLKVTDIKVNQGLNDVLFSVE